MPVVYSGTTLKADGTMTGKRLAALVGLRDRARRVLQSQNGGWPEANRNEPRRDLCRAYGNAHSALKAKAKARRSNRTKKEPRSESTSGSGEMDWKVQKASPLPLSHSSRGL